MGRINFLAIWCDIARKFSKGKRENEIKIYNKHVYSDIEVKEMANFDL
jgi:hypothetical protein